MGTDLRYDGFMRDLDPTLHPFPTRHVEIANGIPIRNLVPGRELRVFMVGVDEHAVRIEYEIVPSGSSPHEWRLAGRDDLGTVYDDGGGAAGETPDGQRTEGIRSITGVPAPDASWIEIAFYRSGSVTPKFDANGEADYTTYIGKAFEHAAHVLRVSFPLVIND
jgi:hypothetical protein